MWDMLDAMFRATPDAPSTPTASGGAGYDTVTGAPLAAVAGAAQQDPSAPQFSPSGAFLAAGAAAGANKVSQRTGGCCFIRICIHADVPPPPLLRVPHKGHQRLDEACRDGQGPGAGRRILRGRGHDESA